MMRNTSLLLSLLFCLVAGPWVAAQDLTYVFTDLGEAGDLGSEARAINDDGVVVGSISFNSGGTPRERAFWYSEGVRHFDFDGGSAPNMRSSALAVNAAGCAVGWTQATDGAPIYLATWKAADSCPFNDSISYEGLGGSSTAGRGINAAHQVVGTSETGGGEYHAFSKTLGVTNMADLGVLGGGWGSAALAINNEGVSVGYSSSSTVVQTAVIWDGGGPVELGAFPGAPAATESYAHAINDLPTPQIVGWSDGSPTGGQQHACIWHGGTMVDLPTLDGGNMSEANDVNDHGDVVGWARAADFYVYAVMWVDGQITDLNTVAGIPAGWVLADGRGINNSGQIVGRGVFGGSDRAFLLTPVLFGDDFEDGTLGGWDSVFP